MTSTIEGTLDHALFLARHMPRCNLQSAAVVVLIELGIPKHRLGHDYLKRAIVQFCKDPVQAYSKGIYSEIAAVYGLDANDRSIEQAMRGAISAAWKNRNEDVWKRYFRTDADGKLKKPCNTEFVAGIACFLELVQGCYGGDDWYEEE